MAVWAWLAIGMLAWLTLSIVVGLFVAALLGRASRDVPVGIGEEALWSSRLRRGVRGIRLRRLVRSR